MKNMDDWAKESWLSATSADYLATLWENSKTSGSLESSWAQEIPADELERFCAQSQAPAIAKGRSEAAASHTPENSGAIGAQILLERYRFEGFLHARTNPLDRESEKKPQWAQLPAEIVSLEQLPDEQRFGCSDFASWQKRVSEFYCGPIGVEVGHLSCQQRHWAHTEYEKVAQITCSDALKTEFFERLAAAEGLERTLATRFPGAKRFSLEGLDSFVLLVEQLLKESVLSHGVEEVTLGLAHRGRLNLMINSLGKKPSDLFEEFEGHKELPIDSSGDVKYHQGFSAAMSFEGKELHVALSFNPSHLEIIGPVIHGSCRARMNTMGRFRKGNVLPVVVHGDAAIAGQGVVMELLNMSQTPGYGVKGSVHIVLNNQIGFTTSKPQEARSTRSCTDIAKMLGAPVLHVDADNPEAVWRAAIWAARWRAQYHSDVFLNLIGYRRQGHNEADDPSVTQPLMYQAIKAQPTAMAVWGKSLSETGVLSAERQETIRKDYRKRLEAGEVVAPYYRPTPVTRFFDWGPYLGKGLRQSAVSTGVPIPSLRKIGAKIVASAQKLSLHPRVAKIFEARAAMYQQEQDLDWGAAELLAYATLLQEGFSLRLSGQDSQRGTFFHRHAVVFDKETGAEKNILEGFCAKDSGCEVINSLLSEVAVMGFEYGFSMTDPKTLVIWEAQFGDFANGAQVVIDQFLCSGERKWQRLSGLTLFLPHGYEGQGPEHSSARIERFLQLCAQDNMRVVYPSTPAQIFHLLRSQMKAHNRHPLVVFTPKSLLRLPAATSSLKELSEGGFREIIMHESHQARVRKILFCSGKIYYELAAEQDKGGHSDVLIVRVEQLYPFPSEKIAQIASENGLVTELVWVQEEPRNQGAWSFVRPLLEKALRKRVRYVGRKEQASPAVGASSVHEREQSAIISAAFTEREGAPSSKP